MMWDERPLRRIADHIVAGGPQCRTGFHYGGYFVPPSGLCPLPFRGLRWTLETYGSHMGVSLQDLRMVQKVAASPHCETTKRGKRPPSDADVW